MIWRGNKAVLRLLWFALTRPGRPEWLMPVAVALELYTIARFNLAVLSVGIVDDLVLVLIPYMRC